MRILLAPDKFKGTFTAEEVCRHLAAGIRSEAPSVETVSLPQADGGEGTLDILLACMGGSRVQIAARDPLGGPITAPVGRLESGGVVVESSLFCGLGLVPEARRDPMRSSTYGLGLALREVLDWNPPEILVGLGGSATVDGGLGLALALGYRLLDARGGELAGLGRDLLALERIVRPDGDPPGGQVPIRILCDVMNPLTGPRGAAPLFAPQKGASPDEVRALAAGLERLAAVAGRDLGRDVALLPGAGAAGGLGAGLVLFAGGKIEAGAEAVGRLTGLEAAVARADLVVTGEGRVDAGTAEGKVVARVLAAARAHNVRAIVVCGAWQGNPWPGVEILSAERLLGTEDLVNTGKTLASQGFS